MSEHFLNRAEVGAALEQMRGERVAQQMRVHARGVEPGLLGPAPEDQEGAGACERAALCIEEQLGAVAAVEVRAPTREVAPERIDGLSADRDNPFLVPLAEAADEAVVERHRALLERDS